MSSTDGLSQEPATSTKRKRVDSPAPAARNDVPNGDDEGPACNSCRRRKTKCSREQPCAQCARLDLDCYYNDPRERPGVKTGAIESLNQRLSILEQMFLGQGILLEPILKKAVGAGGSTCSTASVKDRVNAVKEYYLAAVNSPVGRNEFPETDFRNDGQNHNTFSPGMQVDSLLPPMNILSKLVLIYFENLHPWIPILHENTFKERFADPSERSKLKTILQAMTSVCLRHAENLGLSQAEKLNWSLKCRNAVVLAGMDRFSIANLQALIIVSFDIIGSGRGPSSWSIVGSMARTVEHLQLSKEDDNMATDQTTNGYMITRMKFLQRPRSWKEVEERRRVFWNIFLMDRFCSVATGWNNSLTSEDVKRRLPCEGILWQMSNQVLTPFFGIVDRQVRPQEGLTPTSDIRTVDSDEIENIGGFAFCIEATENLNLVTKFFLQTPVKFNDAHHMQMWLLSFKELDLRLVRWRAFLPPRWRNACVLNQDGIMDPNLTLAHILHNTAVIQLHQAIAYPVAQWYQKHVKLPSDHSAETCVAAAREISNIATQFLAQTTIVINPQFSFCLFVSGRVLLAHARRYSVARDGTLDTIIDSLNDIANRWHGYTGNSDGASQSLASQFARRLEESKTVVSGGQSVVNEKASKTLDIRQAVYSNHADASGEANGSEESTDEADELQPQPSEAKSSPTQPEDYFSDSISLAFPPMPAGLDFPYSLHSGDAPQGLFQSVATPIANASCSQMPYGHSMSPSGPSNDAHGPWNVDFGGWSFEDVSCLSLPF